MWTRKDKLALAVLAVLVLVSLPFLVHPWFDVVNDAGTYIITARSIAAGDGYSYLGHVFHLRPPGFSFFLAPLVALFETDFLVLNLFVSVFGAAGVLLLFCHQRTYLGGPLAALVSLTLWLNPGYQRLCTQVMSDVPGTTLLIACLLVDRWAGRAPSWKREIVLGAATGLAIYVRSLNALLIPAILVSRLWQRATRRSDERLAWGVFGFKRLLCFSMIACATLLPWNFYKLGQIAPPPADQTWAYDYPTGMLHRDPGDPSSPRLEFREILDRGEIRFLQIASVLGSRMQTLAFGNRRPLDERLGLHTAIALVFLIAVGFAVLRRRDPASLVCIANLIAIPLYFGFRERLLLPVFVLALPIVVGVTRQGLRRLVGDRAAGVLLLLPLLLLLLVDFRPRNGWAAIEKKHRAYLDQLGAVAATLAPDSRVGTFSEHNTYSVYLGLPVACFQYAVLRAGNLGAIEQIIDRYALDTIALGIHPEGAGPGSRRDPGTARYLRENYGFGSRVGPATIWRVRPTPSGRSLDVGQNGRSIAR
jgi:hypothetical protein